jgi:hypothetical protein
MPEPADPTDTSIENSASDQASSAPSLARRALAPQAISNAPWNTVEDAVRALHDAATPAQDQQWWRDGISATLSLLHEASDVQLSPAKHFLLFRGRHHRNRPRRWFAVHVATGTHLIQLSELWMHDATSPVGAELDLSPQAIVDYADAVERLPGRHGRPVDWSATTDLYTEISRWQDPLSSNDDPDLDGLRTANRDRCAAARQLHRAAVLHAVAADPAGEVVSATVQRVVLDLLAAPPRVNGRDLADLTQDLRGFLVDLNGGRRRDRRDTRTPEVRQGDARTTEVTTLAALSVLAGQARPAVQALRDHTVWLREKKNWYVPPDRIKRLQRIALLIAELFSPAPTERDLLRKVTPGDVIVLLYRGCDDMDEAIELVVQVTGPAQYTDLGLANGDEQFFIPVNDLTFAVRPRPAVLYIAAGESFSLCAFTNSTMRVLETLSGTNSALDRWAVLPADAARMEPAALTARTRTASRRAAEAFDRHCAHAASPV